MLVIISDLHLTDGTTGTTIGTGAFEDFRYGLQEMAFDASFRADGRYEPIASLDLVLLGDVFDLIRSTRWSAEAPGGPGFVRPWDDWREARYATKIEAITDAILKRNKESLALLKACSRGGAVTVPLDPDAPLGERTPVVVRIFYLVGNHDWFYHIPGAAFDAIRAKVVDAFGLAHGPEPFPHDPLESGLLMETYRRHRLFARHGDIFDPINYVEKEGRNTATLGDALVVELINRFPHEVRRRMGDLPATFLDGLDELANVRPSVLVPVWVDSLLRYAELSKEETDAVKAIWDELADAFLDVPFVRQQDKPFWPDVVDALQATLHLSRALPFDDIARLVTLVRNQGIGSEFSFAKHALEEDAFESGMADYIVYGHTHHYEVVPLDKRHGATQEINRMYFNSGTWHAIHEKTLHSKMAYEFAHFHVMTYVAFFQGDERKGRRFETWSGTLGLR